MGLMGITIITWIYDSTMSYFQVSLPLNLDNHLEQLIKSANLRKLIGLLCLNTRGSPFYPMPWGKVQGPPSPICHSATRSKVLCSQPSRAPENPWGQRWSRCDRSAWTHSWSQWGSQVPRDSGHLILDHRWMEEVCNFISGGKFA